jgi:hypothetical protein
MFMWQVSQYRFELDMVRFELQWQVETHGAVDHDGDQDEGALT